MMFAQIPAGVGKEGRFHYKRKELSRLLENGPAYLKRQGLCTEADLEHTEARGRIAEADPDRVSERACQRGAKQCGTLGSGNHFAEVQVVEAVFDEPAAAAMGLEKDMVCVMIHSGSRGLGYQVCDDALKSLRGAASKYGIDLPDRQLACAPIDSEEGRSYLGAMCAAANFAWCKPPVADASNARIVRAGLQPRLGVAGHATRLRCRPQHRQVRTPRRGGRAAAGVGAPQGRDAGVSCGAPGDAAAVCEGRSAGADSRRHGPALRGCWPGQPGSMQKTFGTCCHGAGRRMSRTAAVKAAQGRKIDQELLSRGVIARCRSWRGLAEEQPDAYKDVNQVVEVVHQADLARKVARMKTDRRGQGLIAAAERVGRSDFGRNLRPPHRFNLLWDEVRRADGTGCNRPPGLN